MKEVWEDEQVKYRKMDVKLDHPKQKNSRNIGVAVKLSKTPGKIKTPAPLYGEHSKGILKELGYCDEEIINLIKSNISGMKWFTHHQSIYLIHSSARSLFHEQFETLYIQH